MLALCAWLPRANADESTKDAESVGKLTRRVIEGRVTDRDGNPIVDALVQWGYAHDPVEKLRQATTDAEGKYRLEIRAWGIDYRLGVSAEGMAPQWLIPRASWHGGLRTMPDDDAVLPPEKADFQLEPQHKLSGIVVDQQGKPIPAVTVEAETAVTGFHSSFSSPTPAMRIPGARPRATSTGPDGRFTLDGLPPEEVHLTLRTPHRHVNAQNYPVDKNARIVMSGSGRPGVVRVRVLGDDKDPVTEFVAFRRHEAKPLVVHDDEGRFELDGYLTEGDTYVVYVYAKDFAPGRAVAKAFPKESDKETVIQLDRGEPLLGRLVDAKTGKPIDKAKILYGVYDDNSYRYLIWSELDQFIDGYHSLSRVQHPEIDDRGNFWCSEGRQQRDGILFVLAPGYERLILTPGDRPAAEDDGRVQIKLAPEATISGTLLKDGKPQAGVEVWAWRQPRGDIDASHERSKTDAEGKFRIGSLGAGTYGVSCWANASRSVHKAATLASVTITASEQKELGAVALEKVESPKK
jgi:hypothetical protein